MALNKATGNMYGFVTHTWNPIKGRCPHECQYCYIKSMNKRYGATPKEPYLDEKELKVNLGKRKTIFVGSSCDMWAENIPYEWIAMVLFIIDTYPDNKYLFQTKNPWRYMDYIHQIIGGEYETEFPENCVLGTTVETNRIYPCMGKTPSPDSRAVAIERITSQYNDCFITIEPILDFDLNRFVIMLEKANPDYINIGADSGRNNLPEPPRGKIEELIELLAPHTKVHLKKNLRRLLPEHRLYDV